MKLKRIALGLTVLASFFQPHAHAASLEKVVDVPLPGPANRFDYQSFDPKTGLLYIAHLSDGKLVVFDTKSREVAADLKGFSGVHGTVVIPDKKLVFASATGSQEVVALDTETRRIIGRFPAGDYPDGLAYAPNANRVFVSDEKGGHESVIDMAEMKKIGTVEVGGETGNTQYDAKTGKILICVQSRDELMTLDPETLKITGHHHLEGGSWPHGLLVLGERQLGFVGDEGNNHLLVVDLRDFQVKQSFTTGDSPDVLAFDEGLNRLYVASESDTVSVFQLKGRVLSKVEDLKVAPNAHTIAVNPANHEVYLPLENLKGKPTLRIMRPSPSQP
jgi:DNA-binding beta-propeller fold protein YncE